MMRGLEKPTKANQTGAATITFHGVYGRRHQTRSLPWKTAAYIAAALWGLTLIYGRKFLPLAVRFGWNILTTGRDIFADEITVFFSLPACA